MVNTNPQAAKIVKDFAKLYKAGKLPQKELMARFEVIGAQMAKSTLSDYMSNPETSFKKFSDAQLDAMVEMYDFYAAKLEADGRHIVHGVEHAMFYALLQEFGVTRAEELDMRARLPGVYIMHRPSIVSPGHTLITYAKIDYNDKSHVVSFTEKYRVEDDPQGYMGKDEFVYQGQIFPKRGRYFAMQRDFGAGFPRFTILDEVYQRDERVTQFSGVTMGVLGPSIYTSPVYLERWGDDEARFEDLLKKTEIRGGEERPLLGSDKTENLLPRVQQVLRNILSNAMVLWEDHPQRAHQAPEWVK